MAKVLIVDDSKTILMMVKQFVSEAGYESITANDGREALETFESIQGKVDLVITDINMPNLNGIELAEKIREGKFNNKIPIIVLSTEETDNVKEKGKKAGVSAWIVKPAKKETLIKAIHHFLKT